MDLLSLSEIFNERILRIPDYQRGYAWQERQLNDFWDDIYHLREKQPHYTGVITLDKVPKDNWEHSDSWKDDKWLVEEKKYKPFYVVDGQQRLITSMILLQTILETKVKLFDGNSASDIKDKYILFQDPNDSYKKAFLFGYEKDNPSHEFLKAKIFGIPSPANKDEETIYTRNLLDAKNFFGGMLEAEQENIPLIFEKLTKNLEYNLFEIKNKDKNGINVFITFKTMNTRGKPLTALELMKNQLIYLSSLIENEHGRMKLRRNIDSVWKTIYEYLGKNSDNPLSDDEFLKNHWIMYFGYNRKNAKAYEKFLLDKKFTVQNFNRSKKDVNCLTPEYIETYIRSLQNSVKIWFYIHNPEDSGKHFDDITKKFLDKLNRLNFRAFRPLLLSVCVKEQANEDIIKLLRAVERCNFVIFDISRCNSSTGDTEFYELAHSFHEGTKSISDIFDVINARMKRHSDPEAFLKYIHKRYEDYQDGFYHWSGLKYFLYEREQDLRETRSEFKGEINWHEFKKYEKHTITVEHILPQNAEKDCWKKHYGKFNDQQRNWLTHSLGNLLPLLQPKNSSLGNECFKDKKGKVGEDGYGYRSGSKSENKVAEKDNWEAKDIYERGLELLEFMERRWGIKLEYNESIGKDFKKELLHLNFPLSKDKNENGTEQNSD